MTSLTHLGLNHRTKLMERGAAERFAACIGGNARFANVSVVASQSEGKFFVTYQPASDHRYQELARAEVDSRRERAAAQAEGYEIVQEPEARFFYVLSVKSGEVYEATERSCNCPDYTYRGSRTGIPCKHQLMLREGLVPVRSW
jgi:hypothetical protein